MNVVRRPGLRNWPGPHNSKIKVDSDHRNLPTKQSSISSLNTTLKAPRQIRRLKAGWLKAGWLKAGWLRTECRAPARVPCDQPMQQTQALSENPKSRVQGRRAKWQPRKRWQGQHRRRPAPLRQPQRPNMVHTTALKICCLQMDHNHWFLNRRPNLPQQVTVLLQSPQKNNSPQ